MEKALKEIYYDPSQPGSFGGVESIYRAVLARGHKKIPRKKIQEWLQKQETYTLHKPARRRYTRNRVIVGGIDDYWQADLVDLQSLNKYNDGNNFLLTCIDVFSKVAWAVPLKSKTGKSLVEGFKIILKSGRKPKHLQTDAGTEFLNRMFQQFLRENEIHFFTTHSEPKAQVCERFNRTLKTKMWKYFTFKNTLRYIDVLPSLLKSYNHTKHRSIGVQPVQVTKSNEDQVWQRLYGSIVKKAVRFKFQINDTVRISKVKQTFEKGYLPNWTEEIFTIAERVPRQPPVYRLKDYSGETLEGVFYEPELQKVEKEDDVYRIEKVLNQRTRRGKKEYYVKWRGYPDKFNSWVDASTLQS